MKTATMSDARLETPLSRDPQGSAGALPCGSRLNERIFLIGYRGTGKSSVARLLAERLGWQWLDADAVLEARHGRSIRQIFAEEGEAGFRDKEAALLAEFCQLRQH